MPCILARLAPLHPHVECRGRLWLSGPEKNQGQVPSTLAPKVKRFDLRFRQFQSARRALVILGKGIPLYSSCFIGIHRLQAEAVLIVL